MEGFDPEVQAAVVLASNEELYALFARVDSDLTISDEVAEPIQTLILEELYRREEADGGS